MKIVRKKGKFIAPGNDKTTPMSKVLGSVLAKKIYVLDDKGFKEQFNDSWETVRDIVFKWADKVVARNNHLHTEEDFDKYEDELLCISWADVANDIGKKKAIDVIKLVYKNDPDELDMYLKTVFGGDCEQSTAQVKCKKGK